MTETNVLVIILKIKLLEQLNYLVTTNKQFQIFNLLSYSKTIHGIMELFLRYLLVQSKSPLHSDHGRYHIDQIISKIYAEQAVTVSYICYSRFRDCEKMLEMEISDEIPSSATGWLYNLGQKLNSTVVKQRFWCQIQHKLRFLCSLALALGTCYITKSQFSCH